MSRVRSISRLLPPHLPAYPFKIIEIHGNGVRNMRDVTVEIAEKSSREERPARKSSRENIALQRRYGKIGISAVAAAARYQGDGKNPAYAPATVE